MSIIDLLGTQDQDWTYAVMVLEYNRENARFTGCAPTFPSIQEAEDWAEDQHPGLTFKSPEFPILVGGNLGSLVYDNKWDVIAIECRETGEVVSLAHITEEWPSGRRPQP